MEKVKKKAKGNGNLDNAPVLIPFEIVITWGGGGGESAASEYEPEKDGAITEYGTAWENEVLKLPKGVLLSMLTDATKTRCSEMLDGNESSVYLMRVLKRQILDAKSAEKVA